MRTASIAAAAAALALVTPASAGAGAPRASLVALARGGLVYVYERPRASEPSRVFRATTRLGAKRVFLVRGRSGAWLNVLLPTRPNGSTGWLRARDVTLATTHVAIVVELRAHLLTVTRRGAAAFRFRIGVGSRATPTPLGTFYVTELVQVRGDPTGYYGPFAVGLSAFSDAVGSVHGRPAQIAIHGTNDPASIGRDTSNGCIRVANSDIRRLIRVVGLGTPVLIVP